MYSIKPYYRIYTVQGAVFPALYLWKNTVCNTADCFCGDTVTNFKNQLGSLDILEYASAIASENVPDLMSGHCDRMWNDAQIEVEQGLDELYSNLRSSFRNLSPSPNREGDSTTSKKTTTTSTAPLTPPPQRSS